MYLGSRPAVAVARWTTRPDLSVPVLGLPDYSAGWPIHHGQSSNKVKYSPPPTMSTPLVRRDEIRRFDAASAFLLTLPSLTEYQNWPKSEFELVAEEENSPLIKSVFGEGDERFSQTTSDWSISEKLSGTLSKKESLEEFQTVEATNSEGAASLGGDDATACQQGRDFLETELVFNRHVHEMRLALPTRSTPSATRPGKRQTRSVCRPSACRRRVHPVGKFTDELVNWMPQSGTTDDDVDERDDDDDQNDEDFKHCSREKMERCNGSRIVRVNVKRTLRKTCISKHHPKKKRCHLSRDRKEDGLHRRRKQHNPWSIDETRMLIKGVSICGEGHWADIKRLEFSELASRSPVDLKDKWRNLLRLAQMTQNHSKSKKGEKRTDLPAEFLQQILIRRAQEHQLRSDGVLWQQS